VQPIDPGTTGRHVSSRAPDSRSRLFDIATMFAIPYNDLCSPKILLTGDIGA